MKKGILHCADDLTDPRLLVALYTHRPGEERTLRYCSVGSAALMAAYIMTPEHGWKTRIFTLSPEAAGRYLESRHAVNSGVNI